MKKILILSLSMLFCNIGVDAMQVRYNLGLYDAATKIAVSRISSGIQIDEKEVKESLNFLDTRKTALVSDHIYGEEMKFFACVEKAYDISDQYVTEFATSCKAVFSSSSDSKEKAAVHFLLFGVIKQYHDSVAHRKKPRKLKPITFSNMTDWGAFFDKSPIIISD